MLTSDYVVCYLAQKMGSDEKNYGIRWIDYDIGHAAIVNAVLLYLRATHTNAGPFIVLTLVKDGKEAHIWEPEIHFSQAPIGKAWYAFRRLTTELSLLLLGIRIPPFKKGPQAPKEWENERLRINLNNLFMRASNQTDLYPRTANPTLRVYIKRHKKMLHEDGYLRYTETQYETMRQELFRAVTLGE